MTNLPVQQEIKESEVINGFRVERIYPIPELNTTGYEFYHLQSGAKLIHLFNSDPNNLFSIAFRTPVNDNTGVAHILEHSVLCGSKRYPVKDPFQEMMKGSLHTFLNALTYPDKTVYPVSSQVEKDFFNLVSVYVDAVFNPLLSEKTFYQEGWHFEVTDVDKPIDIKGIVYNEMKGVYSNFSSQVERKILSMLFPDTSYHFESGGDPEFIPYLTYEKFITFHRRYYHPSNSFIVLYGNIPSQKTLAFLDENFLNSYTKIALDSEVKLQELWKEPKNYVTEAPASDEEDGSATVVLSWIFGDSTDPINTLAGKIISWYLLETETSPLKRALLDSGLGEDLAEVSGFESDLRQTIFSAGLRKTKPEHTSQIEKIILSTIDNIVKNGFDRELLLGAIRTIEFDLREVNGIHFPYNLKLAERCYRSWIYGGDPFAHCAFEKPLNIIKEHFEKNDNFFEKLLSNTLLNNTHRLTSTIIASSKAAKKLEEITKIQVEKLTSSFGKKDKEKYFELTKDLLEYQKTPSPKEELQKLPRLSLEDLPKKGEIIPTEIISLNDIQLHLHPLFTGGIVYIDIAFNLEELPTDLIPYLSLYCEYITRCGAGNYNYEQMAKRVALETGGVDAGVSIKTFINKSEDIFFKLFFHTKSLIPKVEKALEILKDIFCAPDFSNYNLLKDIIYEERNSFNSAIISSGHHFAMSYAAAKLLPARQLEEQIEGISQLRFLESLLNKKEENNKEKLLEILDKLREIHECVINFSSMIIILTADTPQKYLDKIELFTKEIPKKQIRKKESINFTITSSVTGIEINSAVNFIGKAWRLPSYSPELLGRMMLLSRILSTGYLWDKVRVEGGAYGGMSSLSPSHPLFFCASYRDPNLLSTIEHFTNGLKEIMKGLPTDLIEQNIIGTIGYIDAPKPPHQKGLGESLNLLIGYTPDFRQKVREVILSANAQSLSEIASLIINSNEHSLTILGNSRSLDIAAESGLIFKRERLLG